MRVLFFVSVLCPLAAMGVCAQTVEAPALQWWTILGGSGTSTATAVAADGQGNLYIAGNTTSLDMPTLAAAQAHPGGSTLARIDPASGTSQNIYFQGAAGIGNLQTIAADPRNPQSIYAAGTGGIFHSPDAGNTWTNLAPLPGNATAEWLTVDPTNGATLYASAGPAGAFKSTDGGVSWNPINQGIPLDSDGALDVFQIWVDPNTPAVLLASAGAGLLRSANAGGSWTPVLGQAYGLAFDPFTAGTIYGCSPAGIVKSVDDGQTWTTLPAFFVGGLPTFHMVADPFHQGTLYTAGYGLFRSTDGGMTWTQVVNTTAGSYINSLAADPSAPVIYASAWPNGMLASTDGFNTYNLLAPQLIQIGQIVVAGSSVFAMPAPSTDIFVTKLDASGNFVYTTYFGGSASDTAAAMAVGVDGSVYVTGSTNSTDFPVTPGSYTGGGQASYVFKLKPDGSLAWSTFFADGDTTVNALTVDADGNPYLAGFTGGDLPVTAGAYQLGYQPPQPPVCTIGSIFCPPPPPEPASAFLTKFNASGSGLVFSTYIAGDAQNNMITNASAIALAPNGSIYLAGGNAYINGSCGEPCGSAVFAMNGSGSALLADNLQTGDTISALAIDSSGNVYVAGAGAATVTAGAFQTSQPFSTAQLPGTSIYSQPAFVTKFNSSLSQVLIGTLLSGEGGDAADSLAFDSGGNLVIGGNTSSKSFPARAPFQGNFGGTGSSGFVAGLDPTLSQLLFSTFIGDGPFQVAGAVPDGSGNILLAGSTPSLVVANKIKLAPAPAMRLDSIVNAASRIAGSLSPGETIAALGAGFGPNAQVTINGEPAPTVLQSAASILAVVPADIPTAGVLTVQVTAGSASSNSVYMPAAVASPGIYSVDGSGTGQGYILNSDGSLNSPSNPVAMGSAITILATGVGAIGYVGQYAVTNLPVSVFIDGFYADGIAAYTKQVQGVPGPVYEIGVYVPNPALLASQNPNLNGFVMPPQVEVRMVLGAVSTSNPDWSNLISQPGISLSVKP
jgi:uncharacterized protein (TIGR03437 family)